MALSSRIVTEINNSPRDSIKIVDGELCRAARMIQVSGLRKGYGGQVILEDVTFSVSPRERIGLVGRNGSGKSTIFKLILGLEKEDGGSIQIPKGYRIGTLEQHINFTKDTALEECCTVLGDEAAYLSYKAETLLTGLGFTKEDYEKDPNQFSGGYQLRINLVKALLEEPNMLLLDEPTNYLDIVSIRWLRGFLKSFPGEIIIITHDRDFMDSVTTHTMGLSRRNLKKIKGDSGKFYEQLLMEDEIYDQTKQNLDKKKKQLEKFVSRFKAKASKATQAQSKQKLLDKMGNMDDLEQESVLGFSFNYRDIASKNFLEINNLSFGYEKDEAPLFEKLSVSIKKGDKIGIIGKNGKGKSTLLNVISGFLEPDTGAYKYHDDIKIGHFGQTNVSRLDTSMSIEEEIGCSNDGLPYTAIRNICGAMMFEGDLAKKKIEYLSGGEKARVMLGKILAQKTNFLLLDEPTNHLDVESVEALIEEVGKFKGTVMIVTHTELILRNLVNKLIIFQKDGAIFFDGNYDDFLEKIGWEDDFSEDAPIKKKKLNKKELQKQRAAIIAERSKACNPLKKETDKLEKDIVKAEEIISSLEKEIEAASDERVIVISKEIGEFQSLVEVAFNELSEKSEQLEIKLASFEARLEELTN